MATQIQAATGDNTMVFVSLDEVYSEIDGMRQALFTRAQGLDERQAAFKSSPDRWSPRELVEHLVLSEAGLVALIDRLLTRAEADGRTAAPDFAGNPISLEHIKPQTLATKYQAPSPMTPSGALSIAESVAKLKRSRADLHELKPRLNRLDVSDVCYRHPLFGPLNLYQWVVFVGVHELRHLGQMEDLFACPDFPMQ